MLKGERQPLNTRGAPVSSNLRSLKRILVALSPRACMGATEADSAQVILASSSYKTKGAVHPLRGFLRTELFLLLTQPERGSGFLLDLSPPSNKSAIQKPHKNLDFLFLFKSNFSFSCFLIQFKKLNNHYTLISLQPGGVRDLTAVFYEYGDWDH